MEKKLLVTDDDDAIKKLANYYRIFCHFNFREWLSGMLHFQEYFAKMFLDMRTSIISLSARSLLMTWTRGGGSKSPENSNIFLIWNAYAKYAINGAPTGRTFITFREENEKKQAHA